MLPIFPLVFASTLTGCADRITSWEEGSTFRAETFDFAGPTDPVDSDAVAGFDLDDRASTTTDPDGCFIADFRWPPSTGPRNVDNMFGWLFTMLGENAAHGGGDIRAAYESALDRGDLVVEFVLPPERDGASGPTTLRVNGVAWSGSTESVDAETRVVAFGTPVEIPVFGRDTTATLTMDLAQASLETRDGRISGFIGARVSVSGALDVVGTVVSDEWVETVSTLVSGNADLDPDPDGVCHSTSVAWIFEGPQEVP